MDRVAIESAWRRRARFASRESERAARSRAAAGARRLAGEASVRNFGTLHGRRDRAGDWHRRGTESIALYQQLAEQVPLDFQAGGSLYPSRRRLKPQSSKSSPISAPNAATAASYWTLPALPLCIRCSIGSSPAGTVLP